jgi:DNA-binding NarL/FixJ family response regulator
MTQERAVRILVADDFAGWRLKTRSILQARSNWRVIAEASNGLEAVQMTAELHPDVILLDIGMPRLNGIDAAKRIRQHSPSSRIIFVTQENDADIRNKALSTGADGYVLKINAQSELLLAIAASLSTGHETRVLSFD